MRPEIWRLLPYHRGPSALHFALSDALVRRAEAPSLWWHSASTPALILGPGQAQVSPSLPATGAPALVRRQAGGTAVFATSEVLGLDVALPISHSLALSDIVEAYRWLGEIWAGALRRLGVEAHVLSIPEARAQALVSAGEHEAMATACFGTVSPYEVCCDGRKLVGLAQVRRRQGVLWQSGLHFDFDADALAVILAPDDAERCAESLRRRATGLNEVTVRYQAEDVFAAFAASLDERLGISLLPGDWREDELAHAGVATGESIRGV